VKTFGTGLLLFLFVASAIGGWIFFNPGPPALRAAIDTAPEPIDERSGIYASADGTQHRLVLPALDRDFYRFNLDSWEAAEHIGSADIANGELARPASQPYRVRTLSLSEPETLEGWIFEPEEISGTGIVILHGSGDSDRSNGWYALLADHLARAGHVVILPDKRGSGRSGGDWRNAPFELLAQDGKAWLGLLREETPDLPAYGFVGVSQGGTIAPEAARIAEADFAVALSAAAIDMVEQLRLEVGNGVREGAPGFLQGVLTSAFTTRAKRRQPGFWAANGDYNMLEEWQEWRGPFFLMLGEEDEADNVPVAESVRRLEALPEGQRPEWRVYPGVGHALMRDHRFLPAFERDLFGWLERFSDSDGGA
jgi:pimeloyl-ACP methyl ester carboxylesterase